MTCDKLFLRFEPEFAARIAAACQAHTTLPRELARNAIRAELLRLEQLRPIAVRRSNHPKPDEC